MDKQIDRLDQKYPEITILRTVPEWVRWWRPAIVLTLDSPQAMENEPSGRGLSRSQARQQKSGDSDPQCKITRMGKHVPAQSAGAVGTAYPGPF